MISFYMISLGCSKNQVDTEIILGALVDEGFVFAGSVETADVIVVNTCGFLKSAVQEAIQTVLEMSQYKIDGQCKILAVAGCMVQRYGNELFKTMPEINLLLGVNEIPLAVNKIRAALLGIKTDLLLTETPVYIQKEEKRILTTPVHYAYLKISDGCSNRCAYCLIPSIRGELRSRKPEHILNEARDLAEYGAKELNIIAQDITSYGMDFGDDKALQKLLPELCKIPGIEWIRLLYAYPNKISDELIDIISREKKICHYIDMPIQHISNKILHAMNRSGLREDMEKVIGKLRSKIDDITIRSTLMVGFPGETETDFNEMLVFVKQYRLDRLGVFEYSNEDGTPSSLMDNQVHYKTKQRRMRQIMELQREIAAEKNIARIGKEYFCLIDSLQEDHNGDVVYLGRTQHEAPDVDGIIRIICDDDLELGSIVKVRITSQSTVDEYDLEAEVLADEFAQ